MTNSDVPTAASAPFPEPGSALTHILVVHDLERSRAWYLDVLGAALYRAYEGSVVLQFNDAWLLLVEGAPPTEDKPAVTFAAPADADAVSHSMTIRVTDCEGAYRTLLERGATFLTPPVTHDQET